MGRLGRAGILQNAGLCCATMVQVAALLLNHHSSWWLFRRLYTMVSLAEPKWPISNTITKKCALHAHWCNQVSKTWRLSMAAFEITNHFSPSFFSNPNKLVYCANTYCLGLQSIDVEQATWLVGKSSTHGWRENPFEPTACHAGVSHLNFNC